MIDMTEIDEFVESLAAQDGGHQALWKMVSDFEKFEENFYIDDCLLLRNAKIVSKITYGGEGNDNIITAINLLALHIYKYFATLNKDFVVALADEVLENYDVVERSGGLGLIPKEGVGVNMDDLRPPEAESNDEVSGVSINEWLSAYGSNVVEDITENR